MSIRRRWLDSNIDFARVRQRNSLPIHTLEFFQCSGVSHATVGELHEIVPLVKISELIANRGYFSNILLWVGDSFQGENLKIRIYFYYSSL